MRLPFLCQNLLPTDSTFAQYVSESVFQYRISISGTAAEKKADEDISVINRHHLIEEKLKAEGLCHPNLYPDAQEKDKQWIKYLCNLRRELMSSKN